MATAGSARICLGPARGCSPAHQGLELDVDKIRVEEELPEEEGHGGRADELENHVDQEEPTAARREEHVVDEVLQERRGLGKVFCVRLQPFAGPWWMRIVQRTRRCARAAARRMGLGVQGEPWWSRGVKW